MARNHNYIYLGFSRERRNILKVGMTQQTCYARCKKEDYLIEMAIDIEENCDRFDLRAIEAKVLKHYFYNYNLAKGEEYFYHNNAKKRIRTEFVEIVSKIIFQEVGTVPMKLYEEPVKPNFY